MFPRFASTGRLFSCWHLLGGVFCQLGRTETPPASAGSPFATTADTNGVWSTTYFSFPTWVEASLGELLCEGFDETTTIDPGDPALLYQGMPRGTRAPSYVLLPYRLALLRPAGAPLP